jgi:hypothetical protein
MKTTWFLSLCSVAALASFGDTPRGLHLIDRDRRVEPPRYRVSIAYDLPKESPRPCDTNELRRLRGLRSLDETGFSRYAA